MASDALTDLRALLRNAERRTLIVLVSGGLAPMLVWCDVERPRDAREGCVLIPRSDPMPTDDPLDSARKFVADPGLGVLVGLPPNALLTAWSPQWGFRQATVGDSRALREEVPERRAPRPAEACGDEYEIGGEGA